jgi:hypothetical protein
VTAQQLIELLRREHADVLPFVGSGMTVAAGAPRTQELAHELARRCGVALPAGVSLTDVTAAAEAAVGTAAVQEHLAEMVTGWRLRPAPALIALCAVPSGRAFTTNYDDGLERAAGYRGIDAVSLLPEDVETMQAPGDKQLQVVHLHGMPSRPESLVLPGRGMDELAASEVFQRFVSPRLASSNLLYLGFSFDAAEHHLLGILCWISENIENPLQHYLLLNEAAVRSRPAEMEELEKLGFLTVVHYPPDPTHEMVERVALALAPRARTASGQESSSRETPTTLQPILVQAGPEDDQERLAQKVFGFDHGWAADEAVTTPVAMLDGQRSLLIGGPGMGKTTLVRRLSELTDRPSAHGSLKGFAPGREDAPAEDVVARLLQIGEEPIAREDLEAVEGVLALDGFDETEEHLRPDAVAAILAAVQSWPQQRWLVTSRPCAELSALIEAGFTIFQIVPSRRWARRYLEMRSVPQARVEHAMLDGYGLGDLLGIPLFAAGLADRLLKDTAEPVSPLQLLVDEQYAASAREASREGTHRADLGEWMRSLAVALELRGRASATSTELARVPGPDGLGGEQARSRLVAATLLADIPDIVAFPLKTLQEGLCADAILKAGDPVATLRHFASADVAGVERLREDIELTIDLVFEHAERTTRADLRDTDEPRWARTVLTRGTIEDAREALAVLHDLHVRRGVAYGLFGDGALRSSRMTVAAIAKRWPELIEELRVQLEDQTRSASTAERMRALQTLGGLAGDSATDGWLLPRLKDGDPQVAAQAAAIAGRLRLASAEPALRVLLDRSEERVRDQAFAALVEIVDPGGLVEIGALVTGRNGLRPLAERLLERLDLDRGLALVQQANAIDDVLPWLLARLIETAHPDAWSAPRVTALMRACANLHGLGQPDPQVLADIFARHPQAALDAVRLHRVLDGPWAPLDQLAPLTRLDGSLLAGDDREDLRDALARARQEIAQREEREHEHERAMARFVAVLDEKGAAAEPEDVSLPMGSLHAVTDRHREIVSELVERWWPEVGLRPAPAEEHLDERTRAMLSLGSSSRAKIGDERWVELLDAHLTAGPYGEPELTEDGVVAWLARNYSDRLEQTLLDRLAQATDGRVLSTLFAIAGRPAQTGAVADAALARLRELGAATPWWGNAIGLLAEAGAAEQLRGLLEEDIEPEARRTVIEDLADHGDVDAQLEVLQGLRAWLQAGEQLGRPHWRSASASTELTAAAAELADGALTAGEEELAGFAIAQLQAQASEQALAALATVVDAHRRARPWLAASVEQMARRIATRLVLERLPEELGEIAAEFESVVG